MTLLGRIHNAVMRRFRYLHYLVRARRDSERNLQALSGRNVLVLCYGNIFRSPFVAARLGERLEGDEWRIRSAGFHEREGRSCDPDFVQMADRYGVDLSLHRSTRVTRGDIGWADVIVIMDGRNRLLLEQFGAEVETKAVWVAAWLGGFRADVEDPYGLPHDQVVQVTARLIRSADQLAARLMRVSP